MNTALKQQDLIPTTDPVTPMQMLQIAVQQGADLDKLQKLMDLQERWEKNEAKKAYIAAMSKFRSKCPTITKTRKAHTSMYAGLSNTLDTVNTLLAECGLSHSWVTQQADNFITVQCCVTHIQGHSECTALTAGPDKTGSKNDIQAVGSTVTYLERYTLFAILGMASAEMDDDGGGATEYISESQAANLDALLDEVKANKQAFCKYFKIESVQKLPIKALKDAIALAEAKRKK